MINKKVIRAKRIKANDADSLEKAVNDFVSHRDIYVISITYNLSMTYSYVELCKKEEIYSAVLTYQNIENLKRL